MAVVESMIDVLVSLKGFEDEKVIMFCRLAEADCDYQTMAQLFEDIVNQY